MTSTSETRSSEYAPTSDSSKSRQDLLFNYSPGIRLFPEHPGVRPYSNVSYATTDELLGSSEKPETHQEKTTGQFEYPGRIELSLVVGGLCVAVFLLSVDRTIVTTALPYISDDFHAFSNFGWYGSAYLLTSSVLQPLFGRLYEFFHLKWIFVAALTIFMVGSVVCATAATSTIFILGRAITGVGSAGMLAGAFIIIVHSVPLSKRPIYTAGIGVFYSLGSIAGPLLGGVFTTEVTWRWCFWINLPVGGLTALAMFVFKPRKRNGSAQYTMWEKLDRLDFGGTVLLFGSTIMFFLALNYADLGMPWSDSQIVGLLVGSGVTISAFIWWQVMRADKALMPTAALRQRTAYSAMGLAAFLYSTLLVQVYYLSIYFQAVQSRSALDTGLCLLSYIVPSAIATFLAGAITTKTGLFALPAWIGTAITVIGSGLLVTLEPQTSIGDWAGYLIVSGFGTGLAIQQPFTAVQTVLSPELAPIASTMITFFQTFIASVFIFVGNTILVKGLMNAKIPGVDVLKVVSAGATAFRHMLSQTAQVELLHAYSASLRHVFILGAVTAGLAFLFSLGLELKRSNNQNAVGNHESDQSSTKQSEEGSVLTETI